MNSFRMSFARIMTALVALALLASTAMAQTRGSGRITGKVVDEQGQPVQDAVVKAVMTGQTEVITGKSDKKASGTSRSPRKASAPSRRWSRSKVSAPLRST
jgi:hypothetical protein